MKTTCNELLQRFETSWWPSLSWVVVTHFVNLAYFLISVLTKEKTKNLEKIMTVCFIANRGKRLWHLTQFFVGVFCSLFLLCTKRNHCLPQIEELANRNVLVRKFLRSTDLTWEIFLSATIFLIKPRLKLFQSICTTSPCRHSSLSDQNTHCSD